MDTIISATNISKVYGTKYALDCLSIDVEANQIIGLIGKNGSGKTTFMKTAAGIICQTSGEILVGGEKPYNNLPPQKKMIYSFHNLPLYKTKRLEELLWQYEVAFDNFDKSFAIRLMKYFNLSEKYKYSGLSQGMMSTFNLICAISARTELTMLDEPVLGMDITVRKAVYDILMRDYMEHPRSIIVSSHILTELEGILSQIILIDNGKLKLYKDIDTIRRMAFRCDGNADAISKFAAENQPIAMRTGELNSYAVFNGSPDCGLAQKAKNEGLEISGVKAEDLCVYLTENRKESDFECLWQN